jgi:ATP-dependent DNA helicase RecG
MALPLDIDKLLKGRVIEWDRLEFKRSWNPEEIIHTITAFANDVNNWGGGYIIVGVEEIDGIPQFPPVGLQQNQIDSIQKELVKLANLIEPHYFAVSEPVEYQGKLILIIWAAGGDRRPYKAPQTLGEKAQKRVYLRQGSVTKLASADEERFLNTISISLPFDDQINRQASINDLDKDLMVEFLYAIGSTLYKQADTMSKMDLAKSMQLLKGAPEDLHPANVALLFFNSEPHKFFRGAFSEIVQYKDYKGITFTEKTFRGSLYKQIRDVLNHLRNVVLTERVTKIAGQAEAKRIWNFPYQAVEEAVVNAFYHRSYENVNPIEISVYPDKIVILSFPGPLPPIDNEMLKQRKIFARDYRNRRVGDFLKELDLTEGRSTGFPTIYDVMEENGSPTPIFQTDEKYTCFLTILPVNQDYLRIVEEEKQKEMETQQNSGVKDGVKDGVKELLLLIQDNPTITTKELAKHLNTPFRTIQRYIENLKKDGMLSREGGRKEGKWIIL